MLKEVEELRTPCKKIDYCSSYKKIISDEMREKYCRLREEVCCKQNGFIGGIFLLQEIVMQND